MKPYTLRRLLRIVDGEVQLDPAELHDYLINTIVPEIDTPAQDARFEIDPDGHVTQFALPSTGYALDVDASVTNINQALTSRHADVELAVLTTQPAVSEISDLQALGLSTLLATGETNFAGSPKNRIHNIGVGAARFNGVLIPPNSVFSFDQALGPVDATAGYKPELVIKKDKTVPEYGGGLCQVSTTMFRGAAAAGLDIVERRNHAYAVHYYGKPGFDATIYPPYTDFKFRNDTTAYILLQTKVEGTTLKIDFWGQSDGRQVQIDGPSTYDAQPDGSVKAILKRTVRRGGTVLHDDTFYSRYQSPKLFPKPTENPLP